MFRNKEVRRFAVVYAVAAVVASIAGFYIDVAAGMLVMFVSVVFGLAFFLFTRARYRKIAQLADQIDIVLHDDDRVCFSHLDEGELSILQNELAKMTQRIREQNSALANEKIHLADSLADIAHQLKTPLTSANLVLSLLKRNPDEQKRRALLQENEELFAHMDWLLTSLLKLSRLDADIVEFRNDQIEVAALIDSAVHPLAIVMDLHDISLHVDMDSDAVIEGDARWLAEALQNIIKNCIEVIGDDGMIEISCKDTPLFVEIALHDSGKGFDADELSHVFERFYRGKNSNASGYGIGLPLSRSIIVRQGGTVVAKNHPQGGALFVIRFQK